MSDKGFLFGPRLSIFTAGSTSSALWSIVWPWEAWAVAPFTDPTIVGESALVPEIWDCGESFNWIGEASLLVHLEAEQPQDVPQLPPAWRHWHFVVLHKDLLPHEQHMLDALLFLETVLGLECFDPDEFMFFTDWSLLVSLAEIWLETSWSSEIPKY